LAGLSLQDWGNPSKDSFKKQPKSFDFIMCLPPQTKEPKWVHLDDKASASPERRGKRTTSTHLSFILRLEHPDDLGPGIKLRYDPVWIHLEGTQYRQFKVVLLKNLLEFDVIGLAGKPICPCPLHYTVWILNAGSPKASLLLLV
jgi:hypothetical protein